MINDGILYLLGYGIAWTICFIKTLEILRAEGIIYVILACSLIAIFLGFYQFDMLII